MSLIEQYYAAFNARDWDAFFDLVHDDVLHDLNQGPREAGLDTFKAFMDRMNRSYSEQLHDIHVMYSADGSRAAAEYVVDGTYLADDEGLPPATGQTYSLPGGAFFEIENGKIRRITNYYNLQDWIRQVNP
ncbi:ketosteroid isomerase-related protein [Deinococcus misasensis]|uniref:ketosteroid isomerase-related protein n=1 Tax=Deinococcus misasensis TaxID=392413 RepID=UPI000AC8DB00|nr:ketosteroid isomerase-related protein [Deinococcus misasensis]